MEAGGGAHHAGRFCLEHGHKPRLMLPLYVRPYVKVHKTDDQDAEAIAEAATRPTMSFVTLKTPEQLDVSALHRACERLVQNRMRLVNQARGFLIERGIQIGTGRHVFQEELLRRLEEGATKLVPGMARLLADVSAGLGEIIERITTLDADIRAAAKRDANMQRLMETPGIGPTIASALFAAVGDGSASAGGATCRLGSGSCPGRWRRAGKPGSSASRGAATPMFASC